MLDPPPIPPIIKKISILRQTGRNCVGVAAVLRAKQGPCEPSKDFISKFSEQ